MMRAVLALALIALTGCATDFGGNLGVRDGILKKAAASNDPLPLQGVCVSACVEALSDPNVCVHPLSAIGFHAATWTAELDAPVYRLRSPFETPLAQPVWRHFRKGDIAWDATASAFSHYSRFPRLQARLKKGGHMLSTTVRYLYGVQLIADGVPKCPAGVRAPSYWGG